jgi:DNA-binding response OmpR family regulator
LRFTGVLETSAVASDDPLGCVAPAAFDIPPAAFLLMSRHDLPGLRAALRGTRHTLTVAPNVEAALRLLDSAEFDVVILDLDIPNPASAVRAVRDCTSAPVLGIASGDGVMDMYAAGLDEWMSKPPEDDQGMLFARAAALLRLRTRPTGGATLFGPEGLSVHPRSREVRLNGEPIQLAVLEFQLLEALLRHRGEVMDADEISRVVWGHETFGDRNYVEALVSRLRRKLARSGARRVVSTVRGVGYTIR